MMSWSTVLEIGGFAGLVVAVWFAAGIAWSAVVFFAALMAVGYLIGDS